MSVMFLPPPSASSIPDASETVSGKIRIATSAEATAGTNDLTAMTPAKTKSVVDAAVVGGVTYQGTFDASAPADLSNASKGDLYIISVAGTYQGQTWAVGDHLLINADMGGTLDPAKIDKVDNTDSVTSVAGRTGAVTLSTADISGLATVASTGAYSDLTGAPTLATVATTGAYSDLSGTPSLATVATTGAYSDLTGTPTLGTAAAEDVGTLAGNVVQLDGTAKLPAVDGSQLTNLPTGGFTYQEQSTNAFNVSVTDSTNNIVMCSILGTNTTVLPASSGVADGSVVTVRAATATTLSISGGENIRNLSGSLVASVSIEGGQNMSFVRASTSSFGTYWNQLTVEENTLNSLSDVNTSGAVATNVLKYDGTDWVDGAVAYSEVTGTPTLATVATSGAYSDLSGTPTNVSTFTNDAGYLTEANTVVLQYNSTTTATAVSSKDLHVYRLYGAGGFTLTVSATAANGLVEINNVSLSTCTISGPTFRLNGEGSSGGSTSITVEAGERRIFYLEATGLWLEANATFIDRLADVSITSPSNGEALIYNSTSGDWENGTPSASVAALNDIGDVSAPTPANTNVIKYNSTSGDWESGAVAASEVSGLATVATTGAYSDLSGTPSLATVATTGAYSDLTGTPTLGTAAALDVGTSANNVVQLNGSAQLPAVDGSQLTNLPGSPKPNVTVSSPSTNQTLSAPSVNEEAYIYTPSTAIIVNLVAAATCTSGFKYQIKNRSTNAITINPNGSETIDGALTFSLSTQEASVTLITDGSNWFII